MNTQAKPSWWIVKCNGHRRWHWDNYLHNLQQDSREDWGGPEWIKNNSSRAYIRDWFKKHDVILCYQTDRQEILGLTTLASGGKLQDGVPCTFDLSPFRRAFVFSRPVALHALKYRPKGFRPGPRGTIAAVEKGERQRVIASLLSANPDDARDFRNWLKNLTAANRTVSLPGPPDFDKLAQFEKRYANREGIKKKVDQMIRQDGPMIRALKQKCGSKCQFPNCRARIPKRDGGYYCEVAHIDAVAQGGKSTRVNLIVVCPNHHKLLDYGRLKLLRNTPKQLDMLLNGKRIRIHR